MSHANLSPSSSNRWINCPGSINLIAEGYSKGIIKPDTPSIYASEGTAAHDLAEKGLSQNINIFDLENTQSEVENAITITREMCEYVQAYIDFVRNEARGKKLLVEQRVYYTDWVPDGYGTSDAIIIEPEKITCIDLKYGKGLMVDATENTQAILYALGTYQGMSKKEKNTVKTVNMIIYQPRLDHISEWEITIDELLKWGERISQAAETALSGDGALVVGDWCRFCPAAPICKAQQDLLIKTVGSDFEDLTAVNILSDADLKVALDNKANIISWLNAVEKHVTERLEEGKHFDGYKLVAGRSLRQWESEEAAQDSLETILGDKAYVKKLLSPSQAEKQLGKKLASTIQDLIIKPQGKPTLVPESDKRESINISVADFDKL